MEAKLATLFFKLDFCKYLQDIIKKEMSISTVLDVPKSNTAMSKSIAEVYHYLSKDNDLRLEKLSETLKEYSFHKLGDFSRGEYDFKIVFAKGVTVELDCSCSFSVEEDIYRSSDGILHLKAKGILYNIVFS